MADVTSLRHIVIAEDALTGTAEQERRLALTLRDGGDLGVITGESGAGVVVTAGDWPARLDAGIAVVCQVSAGEVRCRTADGRDVPVTVLPREADVFDRVRGIFEIDVLQHSGVAILGLGSGGSFIARELAKAGVGRFFILDDDRLEIANVARHECGLSDVGRLKINAMRERILDHNPAAEVYVSTERLTGESRDKVTAQIDEAGVSLVIGATDNRESRLLTNRMCLASKTPLILGGVFRRAYGGIVQRVIPDLTACYQCYVQALPEQAGDYEISSDAAASAVAYSDRPVIPQPGLSSDIIPIALLMVKLALLELTAGRSPAFGLLGADLVAPLYQWINRRETDSDYVGLAPMATTVDQMTVLRWYGILLPRLDDCAACSEKYLAADDEGFFGGKRGHERTGSHAAQTALPERTWPPLLRHAPPLAGSILARSCCQPLCLRREFPEHLSGSFRGGGKFRNYAG
jgi:molybdopterin/thiamine biosynthesis adenylyltransferase